MSHSATRATVRPSRLASLVTDPAKGYQLNARELHEKHAEELQDLDDLSEEEKERLLAQLKDHRSVMEKGPKVTNKASAASSRETLESIATEVGLYLSLTVIFIDGEFTR